MELVRLVVRVKVRVRVVHLLLGTGSEVPACVFEGLLSTQGSMHLRTGGRLGVFRVVRV